MISERSVCPLLLVGMKATAQAYESGEVGRRILIEHGQGEGKHPETDRKFLFTPAERYRLPRILQEFSGRGHAEMSADPEADFEVDRKAPAVNLPVNFFSGKKEPAGERNGNTLRIQVGIEK